MLKFWFFTSLIVFTFTFIQFVNFGAFALAMYVSIWYNVPYWLSGTLVTLFWIAIGYFVYTAEILEY